MLHRGGQLMQWGTHPETDALWSAVDAAHAAILEARWKSQGVADAERATLLPCAVTKARWPETRYTPEIEARLAALRCTA
jgi:hypothetical protein